MKEIEDGKEIMKRIFFVEDDLSLINGLTFAVKKQGYYDLVILDVLLPDISII